MTIFAYPGADLPTANKIQGEHILKTASTAPRITKYTQIKIKERNDAQSGPQPQVSAQGPGKNFCAFRGTDGTMVLKELWLCHHWVMGVEGATFNEFAGPSS